jgi:hypothetical protein
MDCGEITGVGRESSSHVYYTNYEGVWSAHFRKAFGDLAFSTFCTNDPP